MNNKKCLVPKCVDEGRCRGLCLRHYTRANMLVNRGQTTWDNLIKFGKALPAKKNDEATDWFLESVPDRFKVNGGLAKRAVKHLTKEGDK